MAAWSGFALEGDDQDGQGRCPRSGATTQGDLEYLAPEHWQERRKRAFALAESTCLDAGAMPSTSTTAPMNGLARSATPTS